MSGAKPAQRIEMIPIDRVNIVNPRVRNQKSFRDIVDNISKIGLKKPITVTRRIEAGGPFYDLVCGQGRLEAFKALGQTEVPALVVSADPEDCLIASLVENCARRQHRPVDLLHDIGTLRKRGYNDAEIATKVGCTQQWVNVIGSLIERGEERLLSAVETGILPISVAIEIAKTDEAGEQALLAQAYAEKKLSGGKLVKARLLLEARRKRGREVDTSPFGRKDPPRSPTSPTALLRIFQQEADRERVLVKKAELTQSRLMFIVEAMRELREDQAFVQLLQAERLDAMPADLEARVAGRAS